MWYSDVYKRQVLVKLHHLIADSLEIDDKYKNFLLNVSGEEDIMQLLCIADILITDYSSVFYDFASAKKPILFYAYDLDEYINETRGLYVGMDTLPGQMCIRDRGTSERVSFLLENTVIEVFYKLVEFGSGKELIFMRVINPTPGIWTIKVYGSNILNGEFNICLLYTSCWCNKQKCNGATCNS